MQRKDISFILLIFLFSIDWSFFIIAWLHNCALFLVYINWLPVWFINNLIDLLDWRLIVLMIDWVSSWLIDRFSSWMIDSSIIWLIFFAYWLINLLFHWFHGWLIDYLIDSLADWLIDLLFNWFFSWFHDWSIIWSIF